MNDNENYLELALIFGCSTILSICGVFTYYAVAAILQAHA